MVRVQMRAKNKIDLFRPDAYSSQVREKVVAVSLMPRAVPVAGLVVPNAGVDQDRVALVVGVLALDR